MEDNTAEVEKPISKRPFRVIRIIINLLLLITTVIIIVQNSNKITIDFLWTQFDVSIALLTFITGSVGSVITLFFLFFRK